MVEEGEASPSNVLFVEVLGDNSALGFAHATEAACYSIRGLWFSFLKCKGLEARGVLEDVRL